MHLHVNLMNLICDFQTENPSLFGGTERKELEGISDCESGNS